MAGACGIRTEAGGKQVILLDISTKACPGAIVSVDDCDRDTLEAWRWTPERRPGGACYVTRRPRGQRKVYLHREIMQPPAGMVVDHIDRNPLNNTRANLRVVSPRENSFNKGGRLGRSRYLGVVPCRGMWRAEIGHDGATYFLGRFETERDAAIAYDAAALALRPEFAVLNFPDLGTQPVPPSLRKRQGQWGYPGVRLLPSGRFGCRVIVGTRRYSIGTFATAGEAANAAEKHRKLEAGQ